MKLLATILSAALATVGVACSSGPPEEFCGALETYLGIAADQGAANLEGGAEGYAQLKTTLPELIAQLNVMEDAVGDDDVKADIVATREAYEAYVETSDETQLAEQVTESELAIYAYGADCEGIEIPTTEDG